MFPHPDPPSRLPLHPIPLGHPSVPAFNFMAAVILEPPKIKSVHNPIYILPRLTSMLGIVS